jgi:hypothetical protein
VGSALAATTGVDLGAAWFGAHYAAMAALCGVVIVPLLLLGIVQSLARQSASLLLRSLLVNVPLALLLTAVAVKLVGLGLSVTDAMSRAVDGGSGTDVGHALTSVGAALTATGAATGGAPAFVVFLGGLVVTAGAVAVWLEPLVRSAAVEVAVLFLPLALASLAWPAIAHWCRRLVDTLAALVLSKFAIVAVLSLAVGALSGGLGWSPASATGPGGAGPSPHGGAGGLAAVFSGAAMLLLAAFMPFALLRILPMVEAGAVAHLEGAGARARSLVAAPARSLGATALRMATGPAVAGAVAAAAGSDPLPLGASAGTPGSPGWSPPPGDPWSDIGEYPDHPEATAELRRYLDGRSAEDGGASPEEDRGPVSPPSVAGSGRPTGVPTGGAGSPGWRAPRHRITLDHLGPKLVMIDPDEPDPPPDPGPPGPADR